MSRARERRRKERYQRRSLEEKAIDRKIRAGILPRWSLTHGVNIRQAEARALHRSPVMKILRWRQKGTKDLLGVRGSAVEEGAGEQ